MIYLLLAVDKLYFAFEPETYDYTFGDIRETHERERSMVSPRPSSTPSSTADRSDERRAPANQSLVMVAERELLAALAEQAPSGLGMFARPSPEELVAFEHAVHAICFEARRLELRAEELVIAMQEGVGAARGCADEPTRRAGRRRPSRRRELVDRTFLRVARRRDTSRAAVSPFRHGTPISRSRPVESLAITVAKA
jgi:hypothetical protein